MQLNVTREYILKIGTREGFLKVFKGLFNHENRMRRLYAVAFNQENRIRVLEGEAQITEAQFLAAIENLDQITKAQFVNAIINL
jgi:hypothetical protein